MMRPAFCLTCGVAFQVEGEWAGAPVPGFCGGCADGEHARRLADTCARILTEHGPRTVSVAPMDATRWARIHAHAFREWRPGSACRDCGREPAHAVHS